MTCSSCVSSLQDMFKLHPKVSVSVSLLPQRLTAIYPKEYMTESQINSIVTNAGFNVILSTTVSENSLNYSHVKLIVTGMTCSSCVSSLESALKIPGVNHVKVSLLTNSVSITYNPNEIGNRDLISIIQDLGFEASIDQELILLQDKNNSELNSLIRSVLVSCVFAVPIGLLMVLMMITDLDGYLMFQVVPGLTISDLLSFLLATPVQFGVGYRFYKGAYISLVKTRAANMDVLVALGTSSAYFYSLFIIIHGIYTQKVYLDTFFETSVLLITFILIGKLLETIAKGKTSDSISKLLSLQPETSTLVEIDQNFHIQETKEIPTYLVQVGDIIQLNPGSRASIDGTVIFGSTHVDESMLTGETNPILKQPGDTVYSGTVVNYSSVLIKAVNVGNDTTLKRIVSMVEDSTASKAPVSELVDFISKYFVPSVCLISLLTFIAWISISTLEHALLFSVSVLVIACPCALGLAVPTAIMVSTGVASQNGILIKGGPAFQTASDLSIIVFDKTGTLTFGKLSVQNIVMVDKKNLSIWRYVLAMESMNDHPIAKCLQKYAINMLNGNDHGVSDSTLDNGVFKQVAGRGVEATFTIPTDYTKKYQVFIGNYKFLHDNNCLSQGWVDVITSNWENNATTVIYIGQKYIPSKRNSTTPDTEYGKLICALSISDVVRPEAASVVGYLDKIGIETWMLTGDNLKTAQATAKIIGIPNNRVISGVMPHEKQAMVKQLQITRQNSRCGGLFVRKSIVAMVGDGINDAPALAQSDLGIAIGAGSDIAIESACAILMRSNLNDIISLVDLSKKTFYRIKFNLFSAFVYNIIGIPIAAGVFSFQGIVLKPWIAGLAMALSSVAVVSSSLLLKMYKAPVVAN